MHYSVLLVVTLVDVLSVDMLVSIFYCLMSSMIGIYFCVGRRLSSIREEIIGAHMSDSKA